MSGKQHFILRARPRRRGNFKGLAAGIAVGVAGAVLWGVLTYGVGLGGFWMPLAIGAAVGAAVGWGTDNSPDMGAAAIVITVVSVLAGSFLPSEVFFYCQRHAAGPDPVLDVTDDDTMIAWIAGDILSETMGSGSALPDAPGMKDEEIDPETGCPKEVLRQATEKWNAMTADEQDEYRTRARQQMAEAFDAMAPMMRKINLNQSFNSCNVMLLIIGTVLAYGLATKSLRALLDGG